MVFFLGNRDLGNAPRFINSQGPNLQVSRLGPPAQPDHQRSSPQCGVSSARIQKQPTTVLGDPNCRPFPIASSEPRISESAIAVPSFTTPSPSPSPGPRRLEPPIYYEVPPPPDYQAPPPYSRSLVTETLVYEYRTSERHPEAGSYRYDVPGEQRYTHRERETISRERGNTHREFYQNPNPSNSSDIPNTARRERTYRDGLVEIDDDWRYRDLGHMYRGEQVDHTRRDRARYNREESDRRQSERNPERRPKCSHRILCIIL